MLMTMRMQIWTWAPLGYGPLRTTAGLEQSKDQPLQGELPLAASWLAA